MCAQGKDAAGAWYSLVGIVEHQGSMAGGHYISYSARLPGGQGQPSGQPSKPQPSSPEEAAKPAGPGKRPAAAAAAAQRSTPKEAVHNGPVPEGSAAKERVGEADDNENIALLKAARSALQERLAAGRDKLDAEEMLWFRASDAHVKLISWEQVASCKPYLLMYVRTQ